MLLQVARNVNLLENVMKVRFSNYTTMKIPYQQSMILLLLLPTYCVAQNGENKIIIKHLSEECAPTLIQQLLPSLQLMRILLFLRLVLISHGITPHVHGLVDDFRWMSDIKIPPAAAAVIVVVVIPAGHHPFRQ